MLTKILRSQALLTNATKCYFGSVPKWATVDPDNLCTKNPYVVKNLVNGVWKETQNKMKVIDPMNGEVFMYTSDTTDKKDLLEFKQSAETCTKSGLFNPLKNPEKYRMWGDIMTKTYQQMMKPEVKDFFSKLIMRVCPKSRPQAEGEYIVTARGIENYGGDNPRFLCKAQSVAGDTFGQYNTSYRWPYGPVCIVSPFNFPLEIPALQLIGSLITGNRPTLKSTYKVAVVMEQFIRLLQDCGAPKNEIDFINCRGNQMEELLKMTQFRMTQFTGSSTIAEQLSNILNGKIKIEDAGFDWKLLGPDVADLDYVAWQCDHDAYAHTGQKCSAQSILIAHENWIKAGLLDKLSQLASTRNLKDLTVAPVLTWTNKQIQAHVDKILKIPDTKLLFGGKELKNHTIPSCYGSYEPTAIFVPLTQILSNQKYFSEVTTELFGPFQIVTSYNDSQLDTILGLLEKINLHLTAAVVSQDLHFIEKVLSSTVNGTTYAGRKGRTTGAPQNHWFGPSGDPRAAGIGSPEAIISTWTCHREIIRDVGPISKTWSLKTAGQF